MLYYTIPITLILYLLDRSVRWILHMDPHDSAKYFLIHGMANLYITYLAFPDMITTLLDPREAILSPLDCIYTLSIIEAIHLYHIIVYLPKLTLIDWIHHMATFYMVTMAKMNHNGILYNFGNVFLCGLPGGIDYLLLFLVKMECIDKMTEKYINTILNSWIRNPGILFYTCIQLTHMKILNGNYVIFHCAALCFWNAIFFNNRVLINYGASRLDG